MTIDDLKPRPGSTLFNEGDSADFELVSRFVDGELPQNEADEFRDRLEREPKLQRILENLLGLVALEDELARHGAPGSPGEPDDHGPIQDPQSPSQPEKTRGSRGRALTRKSETLFGETSEGKGKAPSLLTRLLRKRSAMSALAAGLVVVVSAAVYGLIDSRDVDERVAAALQRSRQIQGRVSFAGADHYRIYDPPRDASASSSERLPYDLLADLEKDGEYLALAAGMILNGELERAREVLANSDDEPDAQSDLGLISLLENDPEEAVVILSSVTATFPEHGPARWNLGLALEALGLDLGAAGAFEEVAALAEPGWQEEARERAGRLRGHAGDLDDEWRTTLEQLRTMAVSATPVPLSVAQKAPGLTRLYLYDAIRGAQSPQQVLELQAVAEALDDHYGGTVLQEYLATVASSDFSARAPLAAVYRRLVAREKLAPEETRRFLEKLRRERYDDILIGAMLFVGDGFSQVRTAWLDEYTALAEETKDPWFSILAVEQRGHALVRAQKFAQARQLLEPALQDCDAHSRFEYRCVRLEEMAGHVYLALHRVRSAKRSFAKAWRRLQRMGDRDYEAALFSWFVNVALYSDDVFGGRYAVAEAYLREYLQRSKTCWARKFAEDSLAHVFLLQYQYGNARKHVQRALALAETECEDPRFDEKRALVLTHLADHWFDGEPESAGDQSLPPWFSELRAQLVEYREDPATTDQQRAFAAYLEGRMLMGSDPESSRGLLRSAIDMADDLPRHEVLAQKARAYSYSTLVMLAAGLGGFNQVLELIAEEKRVALASQCVVGVAQEDELTVVVKDGSGHTRGRLGPAREPPASSDTYLLTDTEVESLRDCAQVDVLARPPYHGLAWLLPPEVAWRYRIAEPQPAGEQPPSKTVVISGVQTAPHLGLPPLPPMPQDDPSIVYLSGSAATPARVLQEIVDATVVEIHTHASIDTGDIDSARLQLAPDPDGTSAITAEELEDVRLDGHPLVLLAACHGAHTGRRFHRGWSLPDAFVASGARAVVAAQTAIPNDAASSFFAAVRARIRDGVSPARAVREVRLSRQYSAQDWVKAVVVHE